MLYCVYHMHNLCFPIKVICPAMTLFRWNASASKIILTAFTGLQDCTVIQVLDIFRLNKNTILHWRHNHGISKYQRQLTHLINVLSLCGLEPHAHSNRVLCFSVQQMEPESAGGGARHPQAVVSAHSHKCEESGESLQASVIRTPTCVIIMLCILGSHPFSSFELHFGYQARK